MIALLIDFDRWFLFNSIYACYYCRSNVCLKLNSSLGCYSVASDSVGWWYHQLLFESPRIFYLCYLVILSSSLDSSLAMLTISLVSILFEPDPFWANETFSVFHHLYECCILFTPFVCSIFIGLVYLGRSRHLCCRLVCFDIFLVWPPRFVFSAGRFWKVVALDWNWCSCLIFSAV